MYIAFFNFNLAFLSWCYGLALWDLKSWHLGRLLSCERHARIGLFIQLSWFFIHNISISMSTLPFRLDVTVLNWKSSHILVLSLRLLSVNDTQAYGLFIQLSWEVSISRLWLETWSILTFVEYHSTRLCFLTVMAVLEALKDVESDMTSYISWEWAHITTACSSWR